MSIKTSDYETWSERYPTPATPEQLEKLAELYGLELRIERGHETDRPVIRMRTSDGERVLGYFDDSPIERYIARIAEWRRTGS